MGWRYLDFRRRTMLLFTVINDIDAGEAVSKSWSIMKRIIARLSDPKLGKDLAMVANLLIPNYFIKLFIKN